MSELMRALASVLGPAVDAARTTLRDLDEDEVPAKLRKVSASSARSLTPPLTKALLRELDANDWFRAKVIETWERDEGVDDISDAYLRRTDGWWLTIVGATGDSLSGEVSRRLDAEVERVVDLERGLAVEKERVREAKRRADEADTRLRRTRESDSAPLKAALEAERRLSATRDREIGELRVRVDSLHADLRAAQAETGRLLQRHLEVKRDRAHLLAVTESGRSDSVPRDPSELARFLDRLANTVDPYRETGTPATVREVAGEEVFVLPSGISPDGAAAIESLVSSPVPLVVIVDGYNVLGCIDATKMATGAARRDLITMLGRLLRFLRKGRVVAVFDSVLSDGRSATRDDSGVEVRFADAGSIADDAIVEMAADLGSRAVIISDDREVRERSDVHGATVLWSQALVSWFGAATTG